jgi:hypothetical protein
MNLRVRKVTDDSDILAGVATITSNVEDVECAQGRRHTFQRSGRNLAGRRNFGFSIAAGPSPRAPQAGSK